MEITFGCNNKNKKQLKYPSSEDLLSKVWYINSIETTVCS